MSAEKLDHVVAGAIFDFIGYLTSRSEVLVLSKKHDVAPAVEAIQEFLTLRGVDQQCEPMVSEWHGRCSCLHLKDCQSASVDSMVLDKE